MDIHTAREHVDFCRRDFLAAVVKNRAAADALASAKARLDTANGVVALLLERESRG